MGTAASRRGSWWVGRSLGLLVAATMVGSGLAVALPQPALAASAPGAPTGVTVTVGHSGLAEVDWHRPASDGGSPIQYWVIRNNPTDPGTATAEVADYGDHLSAQQFADNGVTYRFAVAAVNAVGQGPWSVAAAPVTPRPVVSLAANTSTTPEGSSGTHAVGFTVRLDLPSAQAVSLTYTTATAGAGTDFVATSGALTFAPGQTTKTINVPVIGDRLYETNEKVSMRISDVVNGVFGQRTAATTIVNDDPAPALRIADASAPEGASGTTKINVPVTLSTASGAVTKVHWQTADGTARAGTDYVAASGTLKLAAGATSGTIVVKVLGDRTAEPNETVFVDLDSPTGATLADGHSIVTIRNDD